MYVYLHTQKKTTLKDQRVIEKSIVVFVLTFNND